MHYGTFALADDGEDEPLNDLRQALAEHREPVPRFHLLEPGQGHTFLGRAVADVAE